MDRVIRCDCGFEAVGATDDELVAGAQAHARQAHSMDLAAEVVLGLAGTKPPPDAQAGGAR